MGIFSSLFKPQDPEEKARRAAADARVADVQAALRKGAVPTHVKTRLEGARAGGLPWTATLTPAELMIARSHGLRPVAAVSATCWMHYGWSWTKGHSEGWATAVRRLRDEARAAGANAVLDVKMRTVPLAVENSMDFTLIGTAVFVEGLAPSEEPVVATVPALEFIKLLEADVVPTGLAVGAHYEWMADPYGRARMAWKGNVESKPLSDLWKRVRDAAHRDLRANAKGQGSGVLAHVNFSESFETEQNDQKRYLARHIVVATTVDARKLASKLTLPGPDVRIALDLCDGDTPLTETSPHHQSYDSNESEGAI